jgi:hypothetical protein
MINKKRLVQVEAVLPPRQAALLWVQDHLQGKTMREYVQRVIELPASASPRSRVERQVVAAVQVAMKGQDPDRIQQAARQAHMEVVFLISLVKSANSVILGQSKTGWLWIGLLLFMRLYSAGLRDEDGSDDSAAALRQAAVELFSTQLAVEQIQNRYFAGECILATDVGESLNRPTMLLRYFIGDLDQGLVENGHAELVIDSDEFRSVVDDEASKKFLYIRALAKSEMLQHFGLGDAAYAVLRRQIASE